MKATHVFALILLCVGMMTGCSYITLINVYPVQGPAAAMAPPVYYQLTIKGNSKGTTISVALGRGETFQGTWHDFSESSVNEQKPGTAASLPPQPNLAFAWDAVYGQGFFVAHLLGQNVSQATITGSQGTVLEAELQGHRGVAIDSTGNIYKLVW